MPDTISAQDRFLAAFDTYLDEVGVADALSAATTIFVSLVVSYAEARGHDTNQPITINGGENRDITIHGAQLRSAKFGPSALDGDVPVYLESSALALVQALIGAQRAINSMKAEAETAAQGDEQMMLDACEQISNEGLEASLAIQAALSTAAQPPADGALNTIAAMFHSGEEIEGPDGLAMMVDMALWNDALNAFEGIIGDEME